jgi:hypothetical protein
MVAVAETGQLENRRAPTTTLEGWRSFVNADPSELTLLPTDPWEALDERAAGTTTTPGSPITPSWWSCPPRRSPRSPARGRCWC